MRRAMASVVSPRPWEAVDNDFDTEHWDPIMFEEFLDSLQFYFRNLAPGHLRKFLKNE